VGRCFSVPIPGGIKAQAISNLGCRPHRLTDSPTSPIDQDPLKVDPMAIKDIKVVGTFKEGRSIHRAD
jgi:hypothetical protein